MLVQARRGLEGCHSIMAGSEAFSRIRNREEVESSQM